MKFLSSTRYVACLPVKNKILLCYFTLCALRKILSSIHQCFTSPPRGSCKQNLLSFQAIQIVPQCFGLDILAWFWVWIKNLINLTFLQSHQLATSIRTKIQLGWLACLFQNHLILPDGKPRFKRNTSIPLKMFTGCWCGSWWAIKGIVRRTVCHPNLVYTLATVLSPLFFFPVDWLKPFKAFDLIPFTKTTAWPPDGSFPFRKEGASLLRYGRSLILFDNSLLKLLSIRVCKWGLRQEI